MNKTKKAFTITEIMVTVTLMGIVAAFAIPTYINVGEKADEREAIDNLTLIASAMETFHLRNNQQYPPNLAQSSNINTALNTGIIEQNMDYNCTTIDNTDFTCTAVGPDFSLNISETSDGNPRCSTAPGSCPTCIAGGC